MSVWKAIGWFAGGILTGSAGFKALGSGDAKRFTHMRQQQLFAARTARWNLLLRSEKMLKT